MEKLNSVSINERPDLIAASVVQKILGHKGIEIVGLASFSEPKAPA